MFSVYDGYKKVETEGKETYFAGANTARGFVGLYTDIADEKRLNRVYVIKGASGTGKSTLMKKISESCEKSGWSVTRYLCGSDPTSLDCVVIDGRISILDGTAPHIRDMEYPGCASSIIDISRFWDNDILEKRKDEIIYFSTQKSAAYASAYRYIKAADVLESERRFCAEMIYDKEKARDFIDRFLKKIRIKSSPDGCLIHRFNYGLTMRGKWRIKNDPQKYKLSFSVSDEKGLAPIFMQQLADELSYAGKAAEVYHMPIGNNISDIAVGNVLISVNDRTEASKNINMLRFVRNDVSEKTLFGRIKLAGKCENSCLDEVDRLLNIAAENHFKIEEIYKSAMDFSSLMEYTNQLEKEILTRL